MAKPFFTTEISDPRFEAHGLRHSTVKSPALGGRGDISVFVPRGSEGENHWPVAILLHGVYGSHWSWAYQAGIHFTAQKMIDQGTIPPMLLAMPSDGLFADGSGYLPHSHADYEKWIVQEVPQVLRELLPVVSEKSDFYIAGLSMGGYGALRLGARYPRLFKAFSGLSSITEFGQLADFYEPGTFNNLVGRVESQESVLETMLAHRENIRPFRFDCGISDSLFEANCTLHEALNFHKIDHVFEAFPGAHTWDYWEKNIEATLRFFGQVHGRNAGYV
jgi:putative tributyrin esterase